jgi:ABC-type sugar transport system ATPase subunit
MDGIVLQDVNVDLGGKRVLSGLSLHLTEARIGILGRNGSGKSTLLRLTAGLIAPSSGTVRVAGLDPARERKAMLDKIGILFQNPDHQILFPTVIEELWFGLQQMAQSRADAEAQVRAALDLSGRPFLVWNVEMPTAKIGTFDTELVREFFQALATHGGITIHVDLIHGVNSHHIAEAAFKAVARSLREAVEPDPRMAGVLPSTKGAL